MIFSKQTARSLVLAGAYLVTGALASEPSSASVTTVFYNGHVFTAEPTEPYAQAVAVEGSTIAAVGSLAAVKKAAGSDALLVDLKGQFLMPGMIDAHAHPMVGGMKRSMASYPQPPGSVVSLVQYVTQLVDERKSRLGDVVVVYDIDLGYWLHIDEIDAGLSSGSGAHTPIVLFGSDGHTAWANRVARGRAGINRKFIDRLSQNERSYYGLDKQSNPNGFVVDVGKHKLDISLPPYSEAAMLAAGENAVRYMNSVGLTGWLEAAVSGFIGGTAPLKSTAPGYLPVYRELSRRDELTAHVGAYAVVRPAAGNSQLDEVEALRSRYSDIKNFSLVGPKVFADGVVEFPSQTGLLSKPYSNTGRTTPLLYTQQQMNDLVTEADKRGMGVHVHAIGDLAVKNTLDAFAAARKSNPQSTRPFVITHVQFLDPADAPRFAELSVVAAMQLLWAVADPTTIDPVEKFVDPAIFSTMYPARSILEAGGMIAGASDWPVSSADPLLAMFQAETRSGPRGVLNARERMPRMAMLYAYTLNAAKALGQSDTIGTIAAGKQADLVLVDRDLLTVPAEELKQARVVWTMFAGAKVFSAR